MSVVDFFKLLRPQQWYKNLLIFLPLVFVGKLFDTNAQIISLFGFVCLCLLSSSNYVLNDIFDRKRDKEHPEKKYRPIAAGKISVLQAFVFAGILFFAATSFALYLSTSFFIICLVIFFLTLLYSAYLKKQVFADIILIGVNFVLRASSGVFLLSVAMSPWLILCTFFLSLFLSASKREGDLRLLGAKAAAHKEVLAVYTRELTNAFMIISTTLLILSYSLYSFLSQYHHLIYSLPFALYTIFRYFYLVQSGSEISRHPEKVYKDIPIVVASAFWLVSVVLILYFWY